MWKIINWSNSTDKYYDLMHCSPPDFSVHGTLQARILENTFHSPGDLSDPGIKLSRQILYHLSHQVHHAYTYQFSSVQSLSRVRLFATRWTAAHRASLSITNSRSPPKPMSIQPSHPLLSPSPSALNLSQHQGLFQWASSLHQVAKALDFQLQYQSFQWVFRTYFL